MNWEKKAQTPKSQVFVCDKCGGKAYYPQANNQRAENRTAKRVCRYRYCPNCGEAVDGAGLVYWPVATYKTADGETDRLFTYEGLLKKEDALDTIRNWADHYGYRLISAEIKINQLMNDDYSETFRVF